MLILKDILPIGELSRWPSMQTVLDSGHTWFLDSMVHELSGDLIVRLVEGIKGKERQFVEVGEAKLGPYYPVKVEAESRCAEVRFANTMAFFVYDESYDTTDQELKYDTGRFLFVAESSAFQKFAEERTSIAKLHQEPYQDYLLCCEDRIIEVLSAESPTVTVLTVQPNLALERTSTWSSS